MTGRPRALIVAGPTASGKSALALALAARKPAVIVNADAMQTYRELRILTARPSEADMAAAPHVLYGVRAIDRPATAAWWRAAALVEMEAARQLGRVPILCGGTGMYLAALIDGLAEIPDPGPAARAEARALLAEIGPAALHARLRVLDPLTAAKLRPSDPQRLARAWEVLRGTGHGLAFWQAQPVQGADWDFAAIVLDPSRPDLRAALAARFDAMMAEGALDEVAALAARSLDPALPGLRAHGVPELLAYLAGTLSLTEARIRAIAAIGQYTRRQATWLRHHVLAPPARTHMIHARYADLTQFSERMIAEIFAFIEGDA